jgi:mRNA-degrading endonuclease toxin of MazEF toxin-antitoxin module
MANPGPGEIYQLRTEEGSHDQETSRPHVVLSPRDENDTVTTLAFGTSSDLEAAVYHAPHIVVSATSTLFRATGLTRTTYVYPSRLVAALSDDIGTYLGRVIDEFPELRDTQLPRALGLGTGTCLGEGRARESLRGRIARFTDAFAELIGARFGVVISEPLYSRRNRIQNFVPVVDGGIFAIEAPCFAVTDAEWLSQLSGFEAAAFMIPLVQSAYAQDDIAEYLANPIDTETMAILEEALASRLFGARVVDVIGGRGDGL